MFPRPPRFPTFPKVSEVPKVSKVPKVPKIPKVQGLPWERGQRLLGNLYINLGNLDNLYFENLETFRQP